MNFAQPHMLWLLLVFPPMLVVFFWWALRERRKLMAQFIQTRLLPGLISGVSPTRQKVRFALLIGGVSLVIIALARPQWGFTWEEVKQKGLDIVVAIDTSKSMLAEDIAPNRLARAKLAALDLMQQAKFDRLGLVAFAGDAFLQCPLTFDDNAFRQSVEALDVNTIPQGGTALAAAIKTALTAFKEGNNFKVLVLFTDGEDNDEGALEAAQNAAKQGMKIFTIGVGTAEGELLRVTDEKGRTDYIRDDQGNVVKSHLNEALLQQIAGATDGGFYLPLRGAKTIDTLYAKGLAPLPKTEGQEKLIKHYHERYHWPLAAAILLLLVEMLLPEQKWERKAGRDAHSRPNQPRQARENRTSVSRETTGMVSALALIMLPLTASASPSSALRDYQSGKYDEAFKQYEQALEKKSDDPRLHFNAGAAAYRDGKLDQAAKHFGEALPAQDLKLQEQAYYNLGNTLYRTGEALPDPQKKMQTWENAVKQYESALKLDTNNADAKFNHDFVEKKLEQLKKQQQQQQKQNQNQNKNQQDKKDQKNQQQKQDEKKNQQSKQQQAKNDQQKQEEKKSQDQSKTEEQQKQQEEQQAKSSGDKSKEKPEAQQSQPMAAHEMTPQEAKQLLDAQKGDEKVLQFAPEGEPRNRERALKDW